MADNALTKLPLAGQLGVSVALGALIFGGFYFFWWSDAMKEEATKKAKREALQKEIRALEVTANKLQEFQREVQLLEAKLETLKRILPPERETPDLMRRVQSLASQSFLTVKKFQPTTPVQKEFYQEVPINMDLTGSYHNLGLFFDRISRLSRLVNLRNLKVKVSQKQSANTTIEAACQALTYVYQDAPPPAAAKAGRPAKK
ncbi:MAG TPA: type 4a pilus biogenesis protein PilO [Vicinamibacteria bacterium]